jgi:pyruvate dehydrogenase E1 component alpha subunit
MTANKTEKIEETMPVPTDGAVLCFLGKEGELLSDQHQIDDEKLVSLFRDMLRTRAFDEAAMRLQRVGRIPAYYPCAGQETHVAVPSALQEKDWIFTAYREQGVRLSRGVPVLNELALWRGMPHAFWDPKEFRITPLNATSATHLPHATGYSYGARLLGRDEVALAMFGDGATSEVDFHAALNFAGVWRTPTVFFCQNNRYAQSTPIEQQTASATLAQKADAYGFDGVRVDGMDVRAKLGTERPAGEHQGQACHERQDQHVIRQGPHHRHGHKAAKRQQEMPEMCHDVHVYEHAGPVEGKEIEVPGQQQV